MTKTDLSPLRPPAPLPAVTAIPTLRPPPSQDLMYLLHSGGLQAALLAFTSTQTAPPSPAITAITKVDRDQDRVISTETTCYFTSRNSYSYFETSALTGHNVHASFWGIANIFVRVTSTDFERSELPSSIRTCQLPQDETKKQKQ